MTTLPPGSRAARTFRRARAEEEHRPEAREREVEAVLERGRLNVGHLEADVRHARLRRLVASGLDEAGGGVHADGLAGRAQEPGDPPRRVAEAAPDVQHALPGLRWHQPKRCLPVRAKARGHDLPKPHKPLEQRPVPGVDRLGVRARAPLRL
jgi:hypothetical protein